MRAIPTTHPCYLPTFQHAAMALLDRADQPARFHGVAGVCSEGWAHDLTLFAGDDAVVEDALDWGRCLAADLEVVRLVLFSAERHLGAIVEDDLARFLESVDDFALDGVDLVDWLRTDGNELWSMGIICGTAPADWLA